MRKSASRDQQLEPCSSHRVFRNRRRRLRIARPALRVNHLDIGRRPFAECHVGNLHDFVRLLRGGSRKLQRPLGRGHRFAGCPDF